MSTNRWVNPVNNNLLYDLDGTIVPSGSIEIFEAGTSTPLTVYSNPDQTGSLGSVLNCDAYGLIPDFHVTAGTQFKVRAYDAQNGSGGSGSLLWTRDYMFSADSSTDTRLDSLEATVNALTGITYNGIVNGGMRVALGTVLNPLTSTFTVGSVNRLYGRVTNVTAGSLTQGSDTAYASAKYAHFSGVSMSSSGVVEAQIRIPAGEAGRLVDAAAIFSCLVRHDVGSNVNYTVTVKTPTTTADDFSALTTIGTGVAQSVATGTDTRLELAVADMGDCSKGIAIEVSATIGASITTKNFRITEAQLEVGGTRTAFNEADYDIVKGAFTALEGTVASANLPQATTTEKGAVEIATQAEQEAGASQTVSVTPGTQHFHLLHPKAHCRFSTDTVTTVNGTYSISSTTCTVTKASHGFIVGNWVYLNFTSGTGTDGWYEVNTVANANTFTVTHTSATTSGNVEYYTCALQFNPLSKVSSVTKSPSFSHFAVNLSTAMASANSISADATGVRTNYNLNDTGWEADSAVVMSPGNYTASAFLLGASDNNLDTHAVTVKYGTVTVYGDLP